MRALFLAAVAAGVLSGSPTAQRSGGAPSPWHEGAAAPGARRAAADFVPVPGVRELSGRLIVRPMPLGALRERGLTRERALERRARARREVARYEVLRYVPQTDEYIVHVPSGWSEEDVAADLARTGDFEYVEPDWLLAPLSVPPRQETTSAARPPRPTRAGPAGSSAFRAQRWPRAPRFPDDAMFAAQWQHDPNRMDSCAAWGEATGRPVVTVGVCDTGIRTTHEDLQLHRMEAYNAVDRLWESQGGRISPASTHGTRTTGTVAANGNNGVGVVGVGWNLRHRMLRVSNLSSGNAALSDLQHGARTSIESGDRVANVSYHGASSASNGPTATYIKSIGGLLLWGAGNTSGNYSSPDRDSDDLIVVGATDHNDALATFSSYGNFVDLVAPGVGIVTTDSSSDTAYVTSEGTSYACPLASGVCAMIWTERPTLSPSDVERILKLSAQDLGAPGVDSVFGYGRIQLAHALRLSGTAQPVARFLAPATSGVSPFLVAFTDQSTGVPTSWSWDFGDGATSTEQNPTHTYASGGAYTVTLTVGNSRGGDTTTAVDYVLVDLTPPVAGFAGSPTGGLSPLLVNFTDLSTGVPPTSWAWTFGDGATSTLQSPSHTYTSSGSYTVTLTVANANGSDVLSLPNYIAVDFIPPQADFSGQPTSGASPMVVSFTDQSGAGTATAWSWSFGDGGSSAAQHPSHTYTAQGSYAVSLTASNAYGSDTLTRPGYVQVAAGPTIVANFTGTPRSGTAPLLVDFTDLSVGNIISWDWNFGDGSTSTLQNPSHVFAIPGAWDIALTVTNAEGKDDNLELQEYVFVQ